MRYRKINGTMLEWSPCDHAWFCEACPCVRVIDGSIDPQEDTWQSREQRLNRRKLNSYLSTLFKFHENDEE